MKRIYKSPWFCEYFVIVYDEKQPFPFYHQDKNTIHLL